MDEGISFPYSLPTVEAVDKAERNSWTAHPQNPGDFWKKKKNLILHSPIGRGLKE